MSLFALAKITIKMDKTTEVSDPVKEMLMEKVKDVPDEYVIKFADVKQAYPDIAEKLKEALFKTKNTLTVKEIKLIVKDMPVTSDKFWLSEVPYNLNAQKKLDKEQVVIQFNFTPEMVREIKTCRPAHSFLTKMFATKEGGVHPLNNQTFAWARVYKFSDAWVIEEMQSDFIGWDSGFKSMTQEQQKILDSFGEEDRKEILAFFKKYFDKWEHTLLASIMQMARNKKAKDLYIFDESVKGGQDTSPSKLKWFYRTVPKHMGMKKENVQIGTKTFEAWKKALAKVN
jgi:phosphopantetheinyl transferase (holo-ACP synthase)